MDYLTRNFFYYTLIPLFILAVSASFYRFMIVENYLVSYEGFCDPEVNSCFVYCETEECEAPLYYSIIEREASVLREICGNTSVMDCENSQACLPDELHCSVSFCTNDEENICSDSESFKEIEI